MALRINPSCNFLVVSGDGLGAGALLLDGSYIVMSHRCFHIAHWDAARIRSVICWSTEWWLFVPKSFSSLDIGLLSSFEASVQTGVVVGQLMNLCVMDSFGACVVCELDGVGCSCLQIEHIPVGPLKLHGRALWNILYRKWLYFAGKKGSLFSFIVVGYC